MELSDPQIIDALLAGISRPRSSTQKFNKVLHSPQPKTPARQRCRCGSCPVCKENQRWDLIFNAKFADPDYYKARPVRHSSSLD